MTDVAKNTIGLKIIVNCVDANGAAVDLTGATNLKIKLRVDSAKESTAKVKTATLEGLATAGSISYTTEDGDLDALGRWLAQGYYEKGTFKGHTQYVSVFTVFNNLDE